MVHTDISGRSGGTLKPETILEEIGSLGDTPVLLESNFLLMWTGAISTMIRVSSTGGLALTGEVFSSAGKPLRQLANTSEFRS